MCCPPTCTTSPSPPPTMPNPSVEYPLRVNFRSKGGTKILCLPLPTRREIELPLSRRVVPTCPVVLYVRRSSSPAMIAPLETPRRGKTSPFCQSRCYSFVRCVKSIGVPCDIGTATRNLDDANKSYHYFCQEKKKSHVPMIGRRRNKELYFLHCYSFTAYKIRAV